MGIIFLHHEAQTDQNHRSISSGEIISIPIGIFRNTANADLILRTDGYFKTAKHKVFSQVLPSFLFVLWLYNSIVSERPTVEPASANACHTLPLNPPIHPILS